MKASLKAAIGIRECSLSLYGTLPVTTIQGKRRLAKAQHGEEGLEDDDHVEFAAAVAGGAGQRR